jgi:Xaa-Pro aminopeptidase
LQLAYYDNLKYEEVDRNASEVLIMAVAAQRSVKDAYELQEMERTMNEVTQEAFGQAVKFIKPGSMEYQVAGALKGTVLGKNCRMAYPVICTINGRYCITISMAMRRRGQLLLVVRPESAGKCPPISPGPIRSGQVHIPAEGYLKIMQNAMHEAIQTIKPGMPYFDVHMVAATSITRGLKEMGLMKGDVGEAVHHGAHALFFPHGIGHMIGLDVHDMEDIGEDYIGYDQEFRRSEQFGTAYLRLAASPGKDLQLPLSLASILSIL